MPPRYRWALLTLAILFVLAGSYAVYLKTGSGEPEARSKVIGPSRPQREIR